MFFLGGGLSIALGLGVIACSCIILVADGVDEEEDGRGGFPALLRETLSQVAFYSPRCYKRARFINNYHHFGEGIKNCRVGDEKQVIWNYIHPCDVVQYVGGGCCGERSMPTVLGFPSQHWMNLTRHFTTLIEFWREANQYHSWFYYKPPP